MGILLSLGFGFLKKFWPYILIGLIVLGGYLKYEHMVHEIASQAKTIDEQKATIATLTNQISQCQAANQTYQETLDKANAAAQQLQQASVAQQKQLATLKGQIAQERAAKKRIVDDLNDLQNHPLAKTCPAAIKELIDAPKDFAPLNPDPSPTPSTGTTQ